MMGPNRPEAAVPPGLDPRSYARMMSAVYDATMAGKRVPARPRRLIWDSWQRMISKGLRPDRSTPPVAGVGAVETLRRSSGLVPVVDGVIGGLESLISNGDNIFALADADGRVLWRAGSPKVLLHADRLGFVEGAHWSESTVGTNALGTALVSQRSVQVFSAEHYNRNQHPWTCSGAPIRNPATGRVMGVIDVTGAAATVHPTTLALVDTVAKLAESHLREQHDRSLNALRVVAAPILARINASAVAVDFDGWVAVVDSMSAGDRVLLPPDIAGGTVWIPSLGECDVEPLPGGWLLRPIGDEADPVLAQVTLDLHDTATSVLEMVGRFGTWRREISLRHAEILLILATCGDGRTATDLAADLYGDAGRVGAARVEMSRLRGQFAGLVAARPYRFADSAAVTVRYPDVVSELLPASVAPAVVKLRSISGELAAAARER